MVVLDPPPATTPSYPNHATATPADKAASPAATDAARGGSFDALLARCGAGRCGHGRDAASSAEGEARGECPDHAAADDTATGVQAADPATSNHPAAGGTTMDAAAALALPLVAPGGWRASVDAALARQVATATDPAAQAGETTAADTTVVADADAPTVVPASTLAAAPAGWTMLTVPTTGTAVVATSETATPTASPGWPTAGGAPYAFARPTRNPIAAAYRPWSDRPASAAAVNANERPGSVGAAKAAASLATSATAAASGQPGASCLSPTADPVATVSPNTVPAGTVPSGTVPTSTVPTARPAAAAPTPPETGGLTAAETVATTPAAGASEADPAMDTAIAGVTSPEAAADQPAPDSTTPAPSAAAAASAAAGAQAQGGGGSSTGHQGAPATPDAPADGDASAGEAATTTGAPAGGSATGGSALLKGLASAVAGPAATATSPGEGALGPSIRAQVLAEVAAQSVGATGREKVTLHLEPAHLGKVQVQLQANGGHLEVVVQAQSAEAEKALADGAKELVAAIVGRGEGRWQSVDVRVERSGDEREERSSRDDRQDRGEQRGENQHDRRRDQRSGR